MKNGGAPTRPENADAVSVPFLPSRPERKGSAIAPGHFFNENAPYPAQWLRNLFPSATVDERSIHDLQAADLDGHARRAHFFAGIGGWELALTLAGWPDDAEVWTGSCPCQPFSSATRGRGRGIGSEQDLWPVWRKLIASIRPRTVFGEQIADAKHWQDRLCHDLEALGYAVGTAILPACSVGFDHVRPRFFFVGHADSDSKSGRELNEETPRMQRYRRVAREVAMPNGIPPRMAGLRAYGNAIVPQVAAVFVKAFMDTLCVE